MQNGEQRERGGGWGWGEVWVGWERKGRKERGRGREEREMMSSQKFVGAGARAPSQGETLKPYTANPEHYTLDPRP